MLTIGKSQWSRYLQLTTRVLIILFLVGALALAVIMHVPGSFISEDSLRAMQYTNPVVYILLGVSATVGSIELLCIGMVVMGGFIVIMSVGSEKLFKFAFSPPQKKKVAESA